MSEKCDIAVECSIDSAEIDVFNIYLYLFGYYVHYLSKQSLSVDTLYREVDEVRIVHIFLPIDEYYSIPVSGFDTLSLVAVEFVYNDVVIIFEETDYLVALYGFAAWSEPYEVERHIVFGYIIDLFGIDVEFRHLFTPHYIEVFGEKREYA